MKFICDRLDSSAVGIEPVVRIRQEQRAGRLVGMLVVVAAFETSEASSAAAGDKAFPWACPLGQNNSLVGRTVHKLESMAKHSWKIGCCLVSERAWPPEEGPESSVQTE